MLKNNIINDYDSFSGHCLEKYFRNLLIEKQGYSRIGSWWDRKGQYEIDLIAENEFE